MRNKSQAMRYAAFLSALFAAALLPLASQVPSPLERELATARIERVSHLQYRVGDATGTPLTNVASLTLGSGGSVLIADAAEHHVLLVDAKGRVARRLGGRGAGPGEFSGPNLSADALGADSVVAIDSRGRLNLYGSGTRVLLSTELFPDNVPSLFLFHGAVAGRLITSHRVRSDTLLHNRLLATDGVTTLTTRAQVTLTERAPDGTVRLSSPPIALDPVTMRIERQRVATGKASARTRQVFHENGRFSRSILVSANGGEAVVYRAFVGDWKIVATDAKGRTLGEIALPAADRRLAASRETGLSGNVRTIGLSTDSKGRIWIQNPRSQPTDQSHEWWVVSPSGRLQRIVQLPARMLPMDANEQFVAALEYDADGIGTVVVLRRDLGEHQPKGGSAPIR